MNGYGWTNHGRKHHPLRSPPTTPAAATGPSNPSHRNRKGAAATGLIHRSPTRRPRTPENQADQHRRPPLATTIKSAHHRDHTNTTPARKTEVSSGSRSRRDPACAATRTRPIAQPADTRAVVEGPPSRSPSGRETPRATGDLGVRRPVSGQQHDPCPLRQPRRRRRRLASAPPIFPGPCRANPTAQFAYAIIANKHCQ